MSNEKTKKELNRRSTEAQRVTFKNLQQSPLFSEQNNYLQMTREGYLKVALDGTKEDALSIDKLKDVISQYDLALYVWDEEVEAWVKLTVLKLEEVARKATGLNSKLEPEK